MEKFPRKINEDKEMRILGDLNVVVNDNEEHLIDFSQEMSLKIMNGSFHGQTYNYVTGFQSKYFRHEDLM